MKFCDKLAKLRRGNNMSQEQLAELLGVSRQAVSKWESGNSMPDMEKIMQLCKILNCSLDELVDDVACGNSKIVEQKININTYLKEVLDFITKTLNMFWSMRLIEKIKCVLEMGFLIIAMVFIWMVVGDVIYSIFDGIIYMLPSFLSRLLCNVASIIYNVFGLIIGTIIFIHIFKVRYLDYFVTIEDINTTKKIIEKPVDENIEEDKNQERRFIEHKKNKIIIRDPKHSTYSFFTMLAHFVVWIIKFILLFVSFFGIISFIILVFGLTFSVWKMLKGVFFIGSTIVILGCIIVNFIILKIIYNFILNQKYNFKVIFYIFIIGFILVGIGFGISFCSYLTFDKIDNVDEIEYTTYEGVLDVNKEKFILDFLDDSRTSIVIDNDRDDIKIEIIYNKGGNVYLDYYVDEVYKYNYVTDKEENILYKVYYGNYYDGYNNFVDAVNYLVDKIESKIRIDDYQYVGISKYKVILSQDSLNKLRINRTMLYE